MPQLQARANVRCGVVVGLGGLLVVVSASGLRWWQCVCVSVKRGVIRVKSEITSFLGLWVRATSSERHCLFVYGRCEILQTLACPGVPTLFER